MALASIVCKNNQFLLYNQISHHSIICLKDINIFNYFKNNFLNLFRR